ncbi:MAG TPA: signal peptidase I [Clostridiaceae bacterium]|nr:signal peptidase I [Clostridiaceae bacterium]
MISNLRSSVSRRWKKVNKKLFNEILSWVLHIAIAAVLGVSVIVFLGRLTIVNGNSMSPTLKNQNVIIIESITPRFGTIQQGDIVVLKIPELLEGKQKYAVKRVIAKENQHIEIRDGKVFVDGRQLVEDYINNEETHIGNNLYADMTVPEGCIYVLGDNRIPEKSRDSRVFGPVKEDRIVGKCWIRIFPFTEAGRVE